MLCLLVGKQSTYFTVSPVTGAGVTRRYWILVAGALGSGRLSPAWHSCGLLGGAPLLPRCTLQGGQPGVKLVWQTPGPHQAGGGPSPLQPALLVSASTPRILPSSQKVFPCSVRDLFSYPEKKGSSLLRGKMLSFLWRSAGQEVLSEAPSLACLPLTVLSLSPPAHSLGQDSAWNLAQGSWLSKHPREDACRSLLTKPASLTPL